MRPSASLIVAIWGGINAALVVLLAGFGESAVYVAIYASAVTIAELFAVAVWYSRRRVHAGRHHVPNGDSVPMYAAAALVAGLAFAYYWPLAPLAVGPLFIAVLHQVSQWRRAG